MNVEKRVDGAFSVVRQHTQRVPAVALVLGSGLGGLADELEDRIVIPYEKIPGIPCSRVEGHAGNLVVGLHAGVPVVAMQGRVHLYEGHSAADVVFGARMMVRLGAKVLVVTNAAGGIRSDLAPADLMILTDHLNLTGHSCLVGPNEDALGPRFPDMSAAYDPTLIALARRTADSLGLDLKEGVYAGLLGPTYETPAEVRMLKTLGADAVGMSTVLEVIAARHMGARVLGLSCITNLAAGLSPSPLSHQEVKETAARVRERFVGLVQGILRAVASPP